MKVFPPEADILDHDKRKSLLRFITCGSVDDGKSTLIGRLLYDRQLIAKDQYEALARDSRKYGTIGEDVDLALLVDGLEAEREQGITIDVAYRFFTTERRKFIVADTPGHEQYTRNMVTGASTADLAVVLIDARKGMLTQTRRHSTIVSLLGVPRIVLAVNKMDLVHHDRATYEAIVVEFEAFAADLGFRSVKAFPISARYGDNITSRSAAMEWYDGPTLIEYLEAIDITAESKRPFRMPVQWVNRPNLDFRGFSGTIVSGSIRPGDKVVVASSGYHSTVRSIITYDGELPLAEAGKAITLELNDEIDVSRGDVLATADDRPQSCDQFTAHLIWMQDEELIPGRSYILKCGTRSVGATVATINHKIDVNATAGDSRELAARTLKLNEIGVINISTTEPIAFEPYADNRELGAFILIDRLTNSTAGAGMIDSGLWHATNIHRQPLDVSKSSRASLKDQRPVVLWFTGLSGAGKSTIANLVERQLIAMGQHTYLLDGDNIRHGLSRDLRFSDADRVENVRRVAEVSKLMVDAGLIVLAALISPFRAERQMAREMLDPGEFIEIYVDTPLEVAQARDPKGLYAKARAGEISNFTGISSPYEPPERPELRLSAATSAPEELASQIVRHLCKNHYIASRSDIE